MKTLTSTSSVTRPADTTAYTAGDVVSTSAGARLTFNNLPFYESEGGLIESAVITSSAYVATGPDLELFLFDTDVTAMEDNAAFDPTDAELNTCIGVIDFATADFKPGDATAGAGGNHICVRENLGITVSSDNLFGVLVVRNAYVPVSAEIFTARISVIR